MKAKHIYSILNGMNLPEFHKFYNMHADPYSGMEFNIIYDVSDEDEMNEFISTLSRHMAYDIVKIANVMRDIYEDVKYIYFDEIEHKAICLYEDTDIQKLPLDSIVITFENMSYEEIFGDDEI